MIYEILRNINEKCPEKRRLLIEKLKAMKSMKMKLIDDYGHLGYPVMYKQEIENAALKLDPEYASIILFAIKIEWIFPKFELPPPPARLPSASQPGTKED